MLPVLVARKKVVLRQSKNGLRNGCMFPNFGGHMSSEHQGCIQNIKSFLEKTRDVAHVAANAPHFIFRSDVSECQATQWETPAFFSLQDREGGQWKRAKAIGRDFVSSGKFAVLTVAGGQGTRLGFDGPKGTLAVTPIRQKTLFQVFAEKILAAERDFNCSMHWFIMTSSENHAATERYFQEEKIFPLERLHLFQQGTLPVFDLSGQVLWESREIPMVGPDGHGGVFKALHKSGCLEKMKAYNIELLCYMQVDNPLVTVVDLGFIGLHLDTRSEMSSKVVRKRKADEKVGVFVQKNDFLGVVEYSDMPVELIEKKDQNGQLCFGLGNVAIHLLNRTFVEKILANGDLPIHVARKILGKANVIKLERFVFDALPLAKNPLLLEVDRQEEFSPVKNLSGVDSLETCLVDQKRRHLAWLKKVGAKFPVDDRVLNGLNLEISPLFADNAETFVERWAQLNEKSEIITPFYLE